jgi:hypothetical protein
MDRPVGLGIMIGDILSRVVESIQLCWVGVKGYHARPVMGAYVSCVSCFSYKIYIDSNHHHRDSRI